MDFSILLYLSMMFYIVQCSSNRDDNLDEVSQQYDRSKSKVDAFTSNFKRLSHELDLQINAELVVPTQNSKHTVHTIVDATLSQINKDVKEALKKLKNGMKISNCIKQARTELLSIRKNKENAIEKCRDDAVMMAITQSNLLDAVRKRGDDLNDQLDSILIYCANPSPAHVQRCVGARVREINKHIDTFATDALKHKAEVRTTFNNVVKIFKKCTSNIVGSARVQISKAKHETDVCLQHA